MQPDLTYEEKEWIFAWHESWEDDTADFDAFGAMAGHVVETARRREVSREEFNTAHDCKAERNDAFMRYSDTGGWEDDLVTEPILCPVCDGKIYEGRPDLDE